MNEMIPTPESDKAMEQALYCTDHGSSWLEVAQGLEHRAVLAEKKLEVCAQLAETWRMQSSVRDRRSAFSVNGALEKCAVELEKALAAIDAKGQP